MWHPCHIKYHVRSLARQAVGVLFLQYSYKYFVSEDRTREIDRDRWRELVTPQIDWSLSVYPPVISKGTVDVKGTPGEPAVDEPFVPCFWQRRASCASGNWPSF